MVQDGGFGALLVAQELPVSQISWFHDYAVGRSYVARSTAWQRLGTGLTVRPAIVAPGRIRVRVAPWLSYTTAAGGGAVEVVEAGTDLVVPAGQRVMLGGATTELHAVTRRILGMREERTATGTGIVLTATLQ